MKLYRYMVGDVLAGGCVLATSVEDAIKKVKAFYKELNEITGDAEDYLTAEVTVWLEGDGFIDKCPDVVEVYP